MVQDINPGSGGSLSYSGGYGSPSPPGDSQQAFTVMNGAAYFIANDGPDGQELWKSDGTAQGTTMVKDIAPGSAASVLQSLTDVDGALEFVANEGTGSNELWTSDGTADGTSLVQSFAQAPSNTSDPSPLGVVDGTLYFSTRDGGQGEQLWKTDQSATGATMLIDLPQSSEVYSWGFPEFYSLAGSGGATYFEAGTVGAKAPTIYQSDGTAAGTTPLFTPDSSAISLSAITASGNSLYFSTIESNDSGTTLDLWKSDGTASGTAVVASIPNAYGYGPVSLTDVNGKLFFAVETLTPTTGDTGYQLWSSDGTAAGTNEVTSLTGPIDQAVPLGNELIFNVPDSTGSTASLWASDGTAAGTIQLQDFQQGGGYGHGYRRPITDMTGAGGAVYFVAQTGTDTQLWSTDGSVAGTMPVTTANAGTGGVAPSALVTLNSTLFFLANDPASGQRALWSSNGTATGTTVITDLGGGNGNYGIDHLVASNNTLFILGSVQPSSNGPDLWESDGTAAGTNDLGSLQHYPFNFTPDGATFFFSASDALGSGLWYAQSSSTPSPNPIPNPNPNPGSNPIPISIPIVTQPSTLPDGPPSGSSTGTTTASSGPSTSVTTVPSTSDSNGTTTSGSTGTATTGSAGTATTGSTGTATTGSTGTATSGSTGTSTSGSTGSSTSGSSNTSKSGSGSSSTSGSNFTPTANSNSSSAPTSNSNATPTADASSGTKTTGSTTTQTSTAAAVQPPAPTIIGEQAIFRRKTNRRGKPVGKPVLTGFAIEFSRPMAATAANSAFYQLENVRAKAHGKNSAAHMSAVGITVSYDASSNTATIQLAGKQSFPKGGILMVSPSVASSAGARLAGTSTFTIATGGRAINPA